MLALAHECRNPLKKHLIIPLDSFMHYPVGKMGQRAWQWCISERMSPPCIRSLEHVVQNTGVVQQNYMRYRVVRCLLFHMIPPFCCVAFLRTKHAMLIVWYDIAVRVLCRTSCSCGSIPSPCELSLSVVHVCSGGNTCSVIVTPPAFIAWLSLCVVRNVLCGIGPWRKRVGRARRTLCIVSLLLRCILPPLCRFGCSCGGGPSHNRCTSVLVLWSALLSCCMPSRVLGIVRGRLSSPRSRIGMLG